MEKQSSPSWKGHGKTPYGYMYDENTNLVVNKEQAAHLKEIFNFALKTTKPNKVKHSALSIAVHLNEKGIKSASGKSWSYKTVSYLFEEKRLLFYSGFNKVVVEEKVKEIRGNWEPIITREMAKELIKLKTVGKEDKPRPHRGKYLLTDMDILKCGSCESSIKATNSITKSGSIKYYWCASKAYRGKSACSNSGVWRLEETENYILTSLLSHVQVGPDKISSYTTSSEKKRNQELSLTIANINKNISEMLEQQNITQNNKEIERLNTQIGKLNLEKNKLLLSKQDTFDIALIKKAKQIHKLEIDEKKKLLKGLIHKIYLFKEKIEIEYRFYFAPGKNKTTINL